MEMVQKISSLRAGMIDKKNVSEVYGIKDQLLASLKMLLKTQSPPEMDFKKDLKLSSEHV